MEKIKVEITKEGNLFAEKAEDLVLLSMKLNLMLKNGPLCG